MPHSVTISVPKGFDLPKQYNSENPQTNALALTLGAQALDALESEAIALVRKETNADAIKEATRKFQRLQDDWEKEAAALRKEKRATDEALSVANARLEALEAAAAAVRAQVNREAKENYQEILKAKESQIAMLQSALESQMAGLTTRVETLQNSLTRGLSSSKEKGSLGEAIMEQHIKRAFDCDVNIISKDSQTADIRMVRGPDAEYLWEVKNYTRMVTTEEVEKLRRDLRLHPEVRGGILVSLRTGIVGHSRAGDIDIEFLEDGRAIVFLSHLLAKEDITFYLQILRPLFQTLEMSTKAVTDESAMVRALQTKATLIANLLRSHATSVAKHKNSLVSHRKRMDTMFAEFQAYVLESETQLQTLLRVAVGSAEESEEIQRDAETYLSALVFQKERLSDLEGRTKGFVAWLLEVAEAREGSQIEIKDMIDRAKERGFSDKFVRELREDIFQGTAWSRGARFIMGLRWKD